MKVIHSLAILVATVTVSVASPVIRPAAVYGPPPGAYQRYQLARGPPAAPPPPPAYPLPAPSSFHPAPPPPQYGAPLPQGYQRAPAPAPVDVRNAFPARPPFGYPDSFLSFSRGLTAPAQQRPQAYKTYIQGIWRYTAPVFPPPIQEDEVPHQGLGATDSVTMPEQAPFDPLLSANPAYHVKALSDREPHFFTEFPHTRLVLSNQQKRLDNGLHANRLGSIRPGSDFLRGD